MGKRISHFWAANAIGLGVWETLGMAGVMPTISATVVKGRRRNPVLTGAVIVAWEIGLLYYLMTRPETLL